MIERSTAVALIGDRYHNSDYIRTALGKTLVRDLELTIDFTDEVQRLNSETLNNYRMLIIFRDSMIWPNGYGTSSTISDPPLPKYENRSIHWMTKEQGQAVKDFVNAGGMALFIIIRPISLLGTRYSKKFWERPRKVILQLGRSKSESPIRTIL